MDESLKNIVGTYFLKEDLLLATPPPHPSEAPVVNPNPLATNPQPATAGTKISLLSFSSKSSAPLLFRTDTNRSVRSREAQSSIQEHPSEGRDSGDNVPGSSDAGGSSMAGTALSIGSAPAFGEGNNMLTGIISGKDAGKRRKPKNNIAKSNSSFISRCIVHENLAKRLQDRPVDGYFAFANINRAFQWVDLSSANKVRPGFEWNELKLIFHRRIILPKSSSPRVIASATISTKLLRDLIILI